MKYDKPDMEIVKLEELDVIRTSDQDSDSDLVFDPTYGGY